MKCDQLEDLILFHAGGAADSEESRAVLEHLSSGCPRCAGRLAEAEAALASLPLAIDPVTPSPEVKGRLMAKVAATPRGASARGARLRAVPSPEGAGERGPAIPGRPPAPSMPARTISAPRWIPIALAAGIAAVVGGIAVYGPMQSERRALRAELARQDGRIQALQEEVRSATSTMRLLRNPSIQVVSLGGAEPQKEAAGRIWWDRKRGEWTFYAANMKPAGEGKTYELWFITADKKKIRAGIFDVDASGEGSLTTRVPEGIGEIALAAVTDEPAGGVDQPTGSIQLVGKIAPQAPAS
jgi:hypothetical protein